MTIRTVSKRERIEVRKIGNVAHVRFTDKKILNEKLINRLGEELFELVEGEEGAFVLNFKDVDFLSSAAIGKLITLDKMVTVVRKKLRLCNIRPEIYEVFAITQLNRLFDIREDLEEALESHPDDDIVSRPKAPQEGE